MGVEIVDHEVCKALGLDEIKEGESVDREGWGEERGEAGGQKPRREVRKGEGGKEK